MSRRGPVSIDPMRWTPKELDRDRKEAVDAFRRTRLEEPVEAYLAAFDSCRSVIEELFDRTTDLTKLGGKGLDLLADSRLLEALRYMQGPPISFDDLQTLVESKVSPARLRSNPSLAKGVFEILRTLIDRRRFPWISEGREPSDRERAAGVLASAALMATQRVGTDRRSESKVEQEGHVRQVLRDFKLLEVYPRAIQTLGDAPKAGEFCQEALLGERKADVVVGLFDGRTLPIECKVSNSATNSIKRLNNDAAAKAEYWCVAFGRDQVVPAAVLSGVFNLNSLESAQKRGLTLFCAHRLADLTQFILETRSSRR